MSTTTNIISINWLVKPEPVNNNFKTEREALIKARDQVITGQPCPVREVAEPFFQDESFKPTQGDFGHQYASYGPLSTLMLRDVYRFQPKDSQKMIWIELGAGYGNLSIRAYERTVNPDNTIFYVNDLVQKNLDPLSHLMEKDLKIKSCFRVVPGDCLSIFNERPLTDVAVQGADFVAALNVIHFFTPRKVMDFFAQMSGTLKKGGKLYLMHDSDMDQLSPYPHAPLETFKKSFTESKKQKMGSSYPKMLGLILQDPSFQMCFTAIQLDYMINYFKKEQFEFPSYLNGESTMGVTSKEHIDRFVPSIKFISTLAKLTGLDLQTTILMTRNDRGIYQEQSEKAVDTCTFAYVFEKAGEGKDFLRSPEWLKLKQKADLADKQRKGIRFEMINTYPFVQLQ